MNFSKEKVVDWGKEVLIEEARAIQKASERLDQSFFEAVQLIFSCQGKVITTGLGKSGYIARKMASTLSSLGTSSFYLHPAEALHGDFGMIAADDCLIAFAYSGETREVNTVSKFASDNSIPVIAITGNLKSTLSKISDVAIDGSIEKEADSLGVAPTASSTLALSLADSLSVAVMRCRGFTKIDFAKLHPGGTLGKHLSNVESYMRDATNLPSVKAEDTFHNILESVTNPNFGIVAIVDRENKVIGAISDGDLRRALLQHGGDALSLKASDFIKKIPKTVTKQTLVIEALDLMEQNKITELFVIDSSHRYEGLLRMHDLISSKLI